MNTGSRPKRNSSTEGDFISTQQSYNSRSHPDSSVTIETSDRGQATPNPKRDLRISFERISQAGRSVGGCVSFYDGEDVKLLINFLNEKFDQDGHLRSEPQTKPQCEIRNGDFSWEMKVDGNHVLFQSHSVAEYFRDHYTSLGYIVTFIDQE